MKIDLSKLSATKVRVFRRSPAFELTLNYEGAPVANVSNEGRGGDHTWTPLGTYTYMAMREFRRELDAIALAGGLLSEGGDVLVSGLADGAKDGQEALAMGVEIFRELGA